MNIGDGIVFLLGVILRRGLVDKVISDDTLLVSYDDLRGIEQQTIVKFEKRWVAQK